MDKLTKTQEMLNHLEAGRTKEALRIAKTFRIGFTKEEMKVVQLGYECLVHPAFYVALKKDCGASIKAAVDCLNLKYKLQEHVC